MPPKKKKPSAVVALVQQALADRPELRHLARYTVDYAVDPRFNELDEKDAYFRGTIYDQRPFNWRGEPILRDRNKMVVGSRAVPHYGRTSKDKAPTYLRRPSSQYALGRIVPNRFAAMLFGNRVFPHIQVPKSKPTEQFLNGVVKKAQIKMHMYNAAILGSSMGSVITAFKVVNGRFRIENFNTKWVTVLWDDFTEGEMEAFSVCYPIAKQIYNKDKDAWETGIFLYRRLITEEFDIEFELQEGKLVTHGQGVSVKPKNPDAALVINEKRTVQHGLGFVPAQFIQNLPRPDQIDGDAACETAYDLIDRINEGLSAVHHAMQGNLDPTLVLKITPEDYKKLLAMGGIVNTGADGEGIVVGDKGDAKFIEITCNGISMAMEILEKLRTYALELCDCVIADPHKLTGAAQSAAAIQLLYAPMLAKTDVLRVQYGEQAFRRMLTKMVRAYMTLTDSVLNEDNDQLEKGKFVPIEVMDPQTNKLITVEPEGEIDHDHIELVWGDYFPPTTADMFQAVEAAVMATGGKPITTQKKAARALAPFFGDHAPDQTAQELEQQEKAEQDHEMKLAATGAAAKAKAAGPKAGAVKSSAKKSS